MAVCNSVSRVVRCKSLIYNVPPSIILKLSFNYSSALCRITQISVQITSLIVLPVTTAPLRRSCHSRNPCLGLILTVESAFCSATESNIISLMRQIDGHANASVEVCRCATDPGHDVHYVVDACQHFIYAWVKIKYFYFNWNVWPPPFRSPSNDFWFCSRDTESHIFHAYQMPLLFDALANDSDNVFESPFKSTILSAAVARYPDNSIHWFATCFNNSSSTESRCFLWAQVGLSSIPPRSSSPKRRLKPMASFLPSNDIFTSPGLWLA